MMNLFTVATLLGLALPATVIPLVLQEHWRPPVKSTVAFLLCLVAAAATLWTRGLFHGFTTATGNSFLQILGPLVSVSFGSYAGLWRNFSSIKWLEQVTTIAYGARHMWSNLTPEERDLAASAFRTNQLAESVPPHPDVATIGTTGGASNLTVTYPGTVPGSAS